MRLWLGIGTFLVGAAIWFRTSAAFGRTPPASALWLPRLGVALGALGIAVMAGTRSGPGWGVSSISFALIAVILLVWVLRDVLGQRGQGGPKGQGGPRGQGGSRG